MNNSSVPAPDIDKLKKTSPPGDPLLEAIRRRGTAQSGEGAGYPEANKIQALIDNPIRIENDRPSYSGIVIPIGGVEQTPGKIDYNIPALGDPVVRRTVRSAMKLTNWRNRIANPADMVGGALTASTPSPAAVHLTGYIVRELAGNARPDSDARTRELGGPRESPFFINVKVDLSKPSANLLLKSAQVWDGIFASALHTKTRSLKPGETLLIENDVVTPDDIVVAKSFSNVQAKALIPGATLPRNPYVFNGVIGRSHVDPGTPYAWLESSTLLQLASEEVAPRLILPDLTAVALIRASDPYPAGACKAICKAMGYPIDAYIRRAAPIVMEIPNFMGDKVLPVLALRTPPSYKPTMTVQSDQFNGYGRMQNIPIWQSQDETFSLDFTLHCSNRAEAINNMEQIQWLVEMIKPTRDSSGNFLTPGGWAYIRIGDMMLHDGETDEMLVFIDNVAVNPREDSPWESMRAPDGTTFQHPMVVDVTVSGKRILKRANGANYAVNNGRIEGLNGSR